MKKLFRNILFIFIGLFLLGGIGASVLIVKAYKELPDLGQLIEGYNPVVPTKIYDTNGEVIDILYKEIRETATIEEMPNSLKNAYVAIEDRRFYSHHGFDVLGMGRAMIVNIVTMSKAQGASSITQQLAKNAFLTNEKRLMRKVKEAIITVQLERGYTKDEILEKYMNEIYFGSGAYGVKTAARAFYGKSVENINTAEAALLAGVPNRPNKYNPRRHLNNAVIRGKLVLSQ
jgi:penicillin-binding protein 1A